MRQKKSILIFGGGLNQLEIIRAAKELGIVSIVIDPANEPPGKKLADFFYRVEGNDYKTTKEIALNHKIDGIVTGQMEKPLRLMARLASELDLPFHSPEVVEKSLDKWRMKHEFISHSVPCASGILLSNDEDLNQFKIHNLSFPLIIKPRDAFSSRGVYKVDSFSKLIDHLEESRSFATNRDVIIEEFLEGREYSIETITWQGKTNLVQCTKKFITPYPFTVEMAHLQPADLSVSEKEEIRDVVIAAINSLGINNSASHAEVMLTKNGPKILEIGARLGGDFIASYLTKASTGCSMDKAAVQIAVGIEPDIKITKSKYSMIKYIELPAGKTIEKILPIDDLFDQPGLIFAWIFLKAGEITECITHSAQRPACVMVEAENSSDLYKLIDKYSELLLEKIILK